MRMGVFTRQTVTLLLALAGLPCLGASSAPTNTPVARHSIAKLEQRLAEIDAELEQLASYSLRSGVGSLGYRSYQHPKAATTEWIQIKLSRETPIDEIVIVPSIWRDPKASFRADGFPVEFRLLAGTADDTNGFTLATFSQQDRLLPRIAPMVVPVAATLASWVRVEATVLSPRIWDGRFELELSEIMVFNGQENVALNCPVMVSSAEESGARRREFIVDGFVPFLMDAAQGEQSVAMVSGTAIGERPWVTIDLGTPQPLNWIQIHATDVDDTAPQSTPSDFGIPRRLIVEGGNKPDLSDAVRLCEYQVKSIFDVGPIITRHFPETTCRYVRLTAIEPYIYTENNTSGARMGFAEIELLSGGRNVALGKPATASFKPEPGRSLLALTDGRNLNGNILPVRDWMEQLARRHDLETERPLTAAELSRQYARQSITLKWLGWLSALLAIGICITLLVDRILRMRQVAQIKQRLAADLHDELGADLHTIGLLSDLAADGENSSAEAKQYHQRIRAVTEQTGIALRHCTNMLAAKGLYIGLVVDMQRTSQRIMAKLEHDIEIKGEEHLNRLKPRTRVDLLLFYKECLVNISRHSSATKFVTRLTADAKSIHLTVSDNGRGLEYRGGDGIPHSLSRRAQLLGAEVRAENLPTGGTRVSLTFRTRRWGRRK